MGMCIYVSGFIKADDKWNKMKEIWDLCDNAGVSVPSEVHCFFGGDYPDNDPGKSVSITEAITEYNGDGEDGYLVDISLLPENVTILKFVTSY